MDETFPVLYILMRSDLDSMNSGKGMAQASHASNAFVKEMNESLLISENLPNSVMQRLFNEWQLQTPQGFGTVLVLAVNEIEMLTAVEVARKLSIVAEVIHDPTYPLQDGDFCHFLPLNTCAYIFGDKNDLLLGAIVGNFPLHP